MKLCNQRRWAQRGRKKSWKGRWYPRPTWLPLLCSLGPRSEATIITAFLPILLPSPLGWPLCGIHRGCQLEQNRREACWFTSPVSCRYPLCFIPSSGREFLGFGFQFNHQKAFSWPLNWGSWNLPLHHSTGASLRLSSGGEKSGKGMAATQFLCN